MKRFVGLIVALVGIGIVVVGIGMALMPLIQTYAANLRDPLGEVASQQEQGLSRSMIRGLIIGAFGVPPLLVGTIMMKRSLLRRRW